MSTTLELKIKLKPEELEGGYIRYTSEDLPGFRILCEPQENPIPLIENAMNKFMPAWLSAAMKGRASIKGLRIIPSSPKDVFRGIPSPIDMEADIENTAS
jgi:hypothetical protein